MVSAVVPCLGRRQRLIRVRITVTTGVPELPSPALCATYNGHSAPKLEQAVLDYLGEFSDPELVKQHLAIGQAKELEQKEVELAGVSRALGDLEGQFLQHLDLLKRGVLSEVELIKANRSHLYKPTQPICKQRRVATASVVVTPSEDL